MTKEEKQAERYVNGIPFFADEGEGFSRTQMQQAYLAGLKAGRPKWYKVADGDLPKEEGSYLFYLYDKDTKSTFYEILGVARKYADRDDMYLESMIWTMNDIIAWCEIPRFEEVEE